MTTSRSDAATPAGVLSGLEAMIRTGALGDGDRLPPERLLADRFGCSRTVLRRALDELEAAGRITRHVGRGTFVRSARATAGPVSPADLMSARMVWEPRLMSMVVLAATEDDFDEMRRCLDGCDRSQTYDEFEAWDSALHRSFAAAAHNNVVMGLTACIESSRATQAWTNLKRRSFTAAHREIYRRQHHDIVAALIDRDRERAEASMRAHVETVRRHLLDPSAPSAGGERDRPDR